ncbi:MAG: AAA family ATPase [Clostridia bacterium]|nr:AAA family ATPase [Clostridia bacterium]
MNRLIMITGDIAAGKSTFARILANRYQAPSFQKDTIKEILANSIGFANRDENKKLSNAAVDLMRHIFLQIAPSGSSLILEANFRAAEQEKLLRIAESHQYDVITLVLRGNADILYDRYVFRMNEENRHPAHLSTALHIKDNFKKAAESGKYETYAGHVINVEASDFSYQTDTVLLELLDRFMGTQISP